MVQASREQAQKSPEPSVWLSASGREISVRAPQGSYAARHIHAELRKAERLVEALKRLLTPVEERQGGPIEIYLIDAVHALPVDAAGGSDTVVRSDGKNASQTGETMAIVSVMQPERSDDSLVISLTRLLVSRWFGPQAARAGLIVEGIAGLIAARTKTGPGLLEADQWTRQEMEEGPVSLIARWERSAGAEISDSAPNAEGAGETPVHVDPAATSFVTYLVSTYGASRLRKLLEKYDPERRDQAVNAAYQRPLAALEAAWRSGLRRRKSGEQAVRSLLPNLLRELKPYRRQQVVIFFYLIWTAAFNFVLPYAIKFWVQEVKNHNHFAAPHGIQMGLQRIANKVPVPQAAQGWIQGLAHPANLIHSTLPILLAALVLAYLLNAVISLRREQAIAWLNQRVLNSLQERMFAHLQRLSHNYYTYANAGDIIGRSTEDMKSIRQALSLFTEKGLVQSFTLVGAIIALIALAWKSPLLIGMILLVLPLFAIGYVMLRSRNKQASREQSRRAAEALSTLQENFTAHAVIKAFGLEKVAIATYHARIKAQRKVALQIARLDALMDLNQDVASGIVYLVLFGIGAIMVDQDPRQLSTAVALVPLIKSLFSPIASLAGMGQTIQQSSGALERVNEILNTPVLITDQPGATELPPFEREIRLEDITFNYGGKQTVLDHLNLTICAGSNVAIVGPTGGGKSTVLNLLMRFWDPEQGCVLFDGHDLRKVTLASLRRQTGYVFQDTVIFETTVRDNIRIGRQDATDAEVVAAAKAARADDFINLLPAKYDTVVTAARLSGGQRQRLGIARAILRDPCILILDEATSALDAKTEAEIQETLLQLAKGRTTISVTHRLSWARVADWIFVLNHGDVEEQGRHEDLLNRNGLYRKLYDEQTGSMGGIEPATLLSASRLRAVPLFGNLTEEALHLVARQLRVEWVAPDADIVRQGDYSDKLYLIGQGRADVLLEDKQGERRINALTAGDFFGEMGLLADMPRSATVRATQPTLLYSLSKADFTALLEREPQLRQVISEAVAARQAVLATANARMKDEG